MEFKAFTAFKSKLSKALQCRSCKTRCLVLPSFKFRLKTSIWICPFRFHRHNSTPKKAKLKKRISTALRSVFGPSAMQLEEMDQLGELGDMTADPERDRLLVSSPVTPAYVRTSWARKKEVTAEDDVEDACRSFENYLAEMIVEERKLKDLMDVEELLHCWNNLKCPAYTDMVGRFYGELCKDLFSVNCQ
ncbi:hypothetical protein NE237_008686 [Protea cynaroides]|uniref:OVATE domain-containing protein n=1 Tax=Protea cynaroides TaxID=273540 RepID=A0A9Q0KWC3_9MAGN|nr:hypothetical protein NE237_008686 [Protea cynaroides]